MLSKREVFSDMLKAMKELKNEATKLRQGSLEWETGCLKSSNLSKTLTTFCGFISKTKQDIWNNHVHRKKIEVHSKCVKRGKVFAYGVAICFLGRC